MLSELVTLRADFRLFWGVCGSDVEKVHKISLQQNNFDLFFNRDSNEIQIISNITGQRPFHLPDNDGRSSRTFEMFNTFLLFVSNKLRVSMKCFSISYLKNTFHLVLAVGFSRSWHFGVYMQTEAVLGQLDVEIWESFDKVRKVKQNKAAERKKRLTAANKPYCSAFQVRCESHPQSFLLSQAPRIVFRLMWKFTAREMVENGVSLTFNNKQK